MMGFMHYRKLGSTGLDVSVVGLGTWQFGGEWGRDYDQSEANAILDTAADCGINLIDTAECYGDHTSEKLIGAYLRERDRSRWIVATKFGHQFIGFMKREELFSPEAVQKQLEASLRALQVDVIDIYQFHSGSDSLFLQEDLWAMLKDQQRAGKIRHLGISITSKGSEIQAQEASRFGVEVLQVYYNRLDRRAESTCFPHAEKNNLGVLARVPLASGFLSGKYKPGAKFPENDVRSVTESSKLEAEIAEAKRIQREEVPIGIPMAQWALAWCLRLPTVTSVIPGCKDPAQVRANAAAAEIVLPAE
jgi:aryl-alcohol dehydrogenase-like predicted oxidoreductase